MNFHSLLISNRNPIDHIKNVVTVNPGYKRILESQTIFSYLVVSFHSYKILLLHFFGEIGFCKLKPFILRVLREQF